MAFSQQQPITKGNKKMATEKSEYTGQLMFRKVKVRLVTTNEMLGMSPSDPKLYQTFIRIKKEKALESLQKKVKGLSEEEKKAILDSGIEDIEKFFTNPSEAEMVKGIFEKINQESADDESKITCFLRMPNDPSTPCLGDWQLKGAIKEFWKGLIASTPSARIQAYVDRIESDIQVYPVDFPLPASGKITWDQVNDLNKANANVNRKAIKITMPEGYVLDPEKEECLCQRPLRAMTAKGPRVSIACSERIPEGAVIEFILAFTNKDDHIQLVKDAFSFGGMNRGLCEWRTGGKGRFYIDLWEKID